MGRRGLSVDVGHDSLATPVREPVAIIYFIAKTTHCKKTVNSLKNIFDQKRFELFAPGDLHFNCIPPVICLLSFSDIGHMRSLYCSKAGQMISEVKRGQIKVKHLLHDCKSSWIHLIVRSHPFRIRIRRFHFQIILKKHLNSYPPVTQKVLKSFSSTLKIFDTDPGGILLGLYRIGHLENAYSIF